MSANKANSYHKSTDFLIHFSRDGDTTAQADPEFAELERRAGLASDHTQANEDMQTFVYSATLSKDLQRNLKKHSRPPASSKKSYKPVSTLGTSALAELSVPPRKVHVSAFIMQTIY